MGFIGSPLGAIGDIKAVSLGSIGIMGSSGCYRGSIDFGIGFYRGYGVPLGAIGDLLGWGSVGSVGSPGCYRGCVVLHLGSIGVMGSPGCYRGSVVIGVGFCRVCGVPWVL